MSYAPYLLYLNSVHTDCGELCLLKKASPHPRACWSCIHILVRKVVKAEVDLGSSVTHRGSTRVGGKILWIQADLCVLLTLPFSSCLTFCLSLLNLSYPFMLCAHLYLICFSQTALFLNYQSLCLPLSNAQ